MLGKQDSKDSKTEELEYVVELEAKVELLNTKLKNFSSNETNYKINVENYKQMIDTKYRDEIQELKLTLSTMLDVNDFFPGKKGVSGGMLKKSGNKARQSQQCGFGVSGERFGGCGERSNVCYEYLKENGE